MSKAIEGGATADALHVARDVAGADLADVQGRGIFGTYDIRFIVDFDTARYATQPATFVADEWFGSGSGSSSSQLLSSAMSTRSSESVAFPGSVSTGVATACGSIRDVVVTFNFGDLVGAAMPMVSYDDGVSYQDVLASPLSASGNVSIPGRPSHVKIRTTAYTSGTTQTAHVSGGIS